MVGALLWIALLFAAVPFALAYAWPDDLTGDSGWRAIQFVVLVARLHLGLAAGIVVLTALMTHRPLLALLALGMTAWMLTPMLMPLVRGTPEPGVDAFTVLTANVYYKSQNIEPQARTLAALEADVLVLQEWTPAHIAPYDAVFRATHPHKLSLPAESPSGSAVYSRFPLRLEPPTGRLDSRLQRLRLNVRGRSVILYNVHPPSPQSAEGISSNRYQSRMLADAAAGETLPTVLAGDFNHTPDTWNRHALRKAGYRSAADDAGVLTDATWPFNRRPIQYLRPRFRIDDVLLDAAFVATTFEVHEVPGSDHAAVLTTLTFAP